MWKTGLLAVTLFTVLAVGLVAGGAAATERSKAARTAAASGPYSWPVKPFDRPHAVRAAFGDPRTLFQHPTHGDVLAGPGVFSFHDGIDIDAPKGTAVYPVESGAVRSVDFRSAGEGYRVWVESPDGRGFVYTHVAPVVRPGQAVTARATVLGRVMMWNEHLHFSEVAPDGRVVDPLLPGHLTPYRDTTKPVVSALEIRSRGGLAEPFDVHGRVALVAAAYDRPMSPERGVHATRFARDGFAYSPAAVAWSLSTLNRHVVSRSSVVDVRRALPDPAGFWSVYARGTYQNRPGIVPRYHRDIPGRYLFLLTPGLDTKKLHDGVYIVRVTAVDARGNAGSLESRIEIWNHGRLGV